MTCAALRTGPILEHSIETVAHLAPGVPIAEFSVTETWRDRVVIVTATGTIDSMTAPWLYNAAARAVQKKPAGFVFDFSEVDLVASAGMQVLVTTLRLLGPNVGYAVVADGPATSRPLKIAGITDVIALYPGLDEALDHVVGSGD